MFDIVSADRLMFVESIFVLLSDDSSKHLVNLDGFLSIVALRFSLCTVPKTALKRYRHRHCKEGLNLFKPVLQDDQVLCLVSDKFLDQRFCCCFIFSAFVVVAKGKEFTS